MCCNLRHSLHTDEGTAKDRRTGPGHAYTLRVEQDLVAAQIQHDLLQCAAAAQPFRQAGRAAGLNAVARESEGHFDQLRALGAHAAERLGPGIGHHIVLEVEAEAAQAARGHALEQRPHPRVADLVPGAVEAEALQRGAGAQPCQGGAAHLGDLVAPEVQFEGRKRGERCEARQSAGAAVADVGGGEAKGEGLRMGGMRAAEGTCTAGRGVEGQGGGGRKGVMWYPGGGGDIPCLGKSESTNSGATKPAPILKNARTNAGSVKRSCCTRPATGVQTSNRHSLGCTPVSCTAGQHTTGAR